VDPILLDGMREGSSSEVECAAVAAAAPAEDGDLSTALRLVVSTVREEGDILLLSIRSLRTKISKDGRIVDESRDDLRKREIMGRG
jgi:hypothetical protein